MSTNVRVKKITTASNEVVGRSNVYHDIFDGDTLISSTLVGKLRKTRGVIGYDAFAMKADGSRTSLGNFSSRSGGAHETRKIYRDTVGLPGSKTTKTATTKTATAPKAKTAKVTVSDDKRDARNARRRELRAAKKVANG